MKRVLTIIVSVVLWAGSAYADGSLEAFRGQSGVLNIVGGTAPVQLMKGAARRIMSFNPNLEINVTGSSSGEGIRKVGAGEAQIGITGRPLKDEEIRKYGLISFPYAIDGVAIAVNPRNPVSGLGREQLTDIFNGKIKNWSEVGGNEGPISVYVRAPGSGARDTFEQKAVTGPIKGENGTVVKSNGAMKTAISRDMFAIGYLTLGDLDNTIKALALDGAKPTQENAANGSYPVTRYLFMNTKGNPKGITEGFINYIFSPEGEDLIRKAGFIPYVEKD